MITNLELAVIFLTVISLLVGASNAITSKDVVKMLKKTTDPDDRAMLKGMVWCKGSHGFHFVFGLFAMLAMLYVDMHLGMWFMVLVGVLAGLVSLMELWEKFTAKVDKTVDKIIPNEITAAEMLKKVKERIDARKNN